MWERRGGKSSSYAPAGEFRCCDWYPLGCNTGRMGGGGVCSAGARAGAGTGGPGPGGRGTRDVGGGGVRRLDVPGVVVGGPVAMARRTVLGVVLTQPEVAMASSCRRRDSA